MAASPSVRLTADYLPSAVQRPTMQETYLATMTSAFLRAICATRSWPELTAWLIFRTALLPVSFPSRCSSPEDFVSAFRRRPKQTPTEPTPVLSKPVFSCYFPFVIIPAWPVEHTFRRCPIWTPERSHSMNTGLLAALVLLSIAHLVILLRLLAVTKDIRAWFLDNNSWFNLGFRVAFQKYLELGFPAKASSYPEDSRAKSCGGPSGKPEEDRA